MRRLLIACVAPVLWAGLAVLASAEVLDDQCWIGLSGEYSYDPKGGTGWDSDDPDTEGDWIYYDQTNWWCQWFYVGSADTTRQREIVGTLGMNAWSPLGEPGLVELAVNWSTGDFPERGPGGPPPMPDEEQYIGRQVVFSEIMDTSSNWLVVFDYTISDLNPQWMSIDLRMPGNELAGGDFHVVFSHWAVPEPGSITLLAIGALGLLAYRWRRR